jgi:aryl-alcohol dehydrogenase-like predicted oxidoreductase
MGILNRRNFLKSTLAGAGGVALSRPAFANADKSTEGDDIITRKLGKTGLEIPVLSMGVMRADTPNLVKAAYDSGITFFDTAHGYQKGKNEVMLGNVLKEYPREKIIVQTKVPPADKNRETGELGPGATKEAFLEKFSISLDRLQMDYVDILSHHGAGSRQAVLHEPILEALTELKKEGKTRFIGVTTHMNEPEVIRAAAESGVIDVVTVAYNFKQSHREEINLAMADAAKAGVGFIGMKSMAGGFLDKEKTKPVKGDAALKWALQDPHLTTCIPGFTSFEQLQLDTEIMTNLELSPPELAELELAAQAMGLFCDGCSQCRPQCRKGLPVPEIMRSYMYAYGYGEMQKASDTLEEYLVDADPCRGCAECTVTCAKGFPVADRIADVSRIRSIPDDFLV